MALLFPSHFCYSRYDDKSDLFFNGLFLAQVNLNISVDVDPGRLWILYFK